MRLMLSSVGVTYLCTLEAEPKKDDRGLQRNERETGRPMWVFQVCAQDDKGGSMIQVTMAGSRPEMSRGEYVTLSDLEAVPWKLKDGREGLSYRCSDVRAVIHGASSKVKVSA